MKINDTSEPGRELNSTTQTDYELLFLQTIGMAAVVLGHYNSISTALNNVFTYFSWHMPLFMFISGILFCRKLSSRGFLQTITVKIRKLLLPALFVNLCYGIIGMLMKNQGLLKYVHDLSLRTLLIDPFLDGYQFGIDIALWFIFQLFIIEILFNVLARLPGRFTDIAVTGIFFLAAVWTSRYSIGYGKNVTGLLLLLLRTGYMSFFFSLGITYEKHLRRLLQGIGKPLTWAAAVLLVQWILLCVTGINPYYNTRKFEFKYYTIDSYFLPPVFSCLAILFLLLCTGYLRPYLSQSKMLRFIGPHLKSVVYHHQLMGILLNCTALLFSCIGLSALVPSFDFSKFQTNRWYLFPWGNASIGKLIYFAIPFLIPILYYRLLGRIRDRRIRLLYRFLAFILVLAYILIVGTVYRHTL